MQPRLGTTRQKLLEQMKLAIVTAASRGQIVPGKAIQLQSIKSVCGPRAGSVEIEAGLMVSSFLKALNSETVRQFIPWQFVGDPIAYVPPGSRAIRIEAGWPAGLAESDVPLSSIGTRPRSPSHFIVGKNERGCAIVSSFDDDKPGYLIGGEPGGGKTLSMRSLLAQISGAAWDTKFNTGLVLLDGKMGEGLGPVAHLPGVVGPLATDLESAKQALAWTKAEMVNRYGSGFASWTIEEKEAVGRIVLVVDEVQSFAGDAAFSELLRDLASQGRAAWVYVVVGTQHPTVKVLNDSAMKASLVGRVGLRTTSYKASEVIFGGPNPRADYLHGKGDSYILVPSAIERVQWAYIPEADLAGMRNGGYVLNEWPHWDGEISQDRFTGDELGVALVHASEKGARDTLKQQLVDEIGIQAPGSGRAGDLLRLAKEALIKMEQMGHRLC